MTPEDFPDPEPTRNRIDYQQGSAEMRANDFHEPKFRLWVLEHIAGAGFITKNDAVNGGAEFTGASPQTTARYLDKLTSIVGPLQAIRDETKTVIITPKGQLPLADELPQSVIEMVPVEVPAHEPPADDPAATDHMPICLVWSCDDPVFTSMNEQPQELCDDHYSAWTLLYDTVTQDRGIPLTQEEWAEKSIPATTSIYNHPNH